LNITENNQNISLLNSVIKSFLSNASNPDMLHITLNFSKPVGDFDFGLNLRTNFNEKKTVVYINRTSIIGIDRSASGKNATDLMDKTSFL